MSPGTGDSAYGTGVDSAKRTGATGRRIQPKREIRARLFVVIPMKQCGFEPGARPFLFAHSMFASVQTFLELV